MKLLTKLQHWLLKRVSRKDSTVLKSNSIYILPTKEGIIYAVMIFLMLSAAINFNNSLVFFCTFLMAGVGLISMHMTQQNLLDLQFSIAHVKPVFCFQNLSLPLIISQSTDQLANKSMSKKKNLTKYSIAIQFSHQQTQSNEVFLKEITDVPFDETSLLQLNSPTTQRGIFELPPLTISTRYPLGLFRAWTNIQLNNDAVIYPNPENKFSHKPLNGTNSEGQGIKGRGFDDFSGFKSYQKGESLKHIHWKAYAREQGMLSKTFTGGNNHEYWLDWNEFSGDTENKLRQLCRLVIDAEEQGDRYGLILPNKTINISRGQVHHHQCLRELAMYQVDNV
ncbi:MAG: DUF58 domain-containing protein [Gammaproteobacteria bacterium]|nr:DUF58 domain-containing protein [Gammaproteobacteria bacterium]